MRKTLLALAALAAAWPAAAAGGTSPLETAARAEGKLVWYAIDLPYNHAVVDLFRKEHPEIALDAVLTGGVQVVRKFTSERDAGAPSADCVTAGVAEVFPEFRRKGYLADLTALPHWKERAAWTKDPHGAYFFYANYKVGFVYNTSLLKPDEVPSSYAELVEPKWKGKVAVVDPATGGFGLPFFRFVEAQKGLGMPWIEKLGKNAPMLSFQAAQLAEAVATGMRPLGLLRDSEAQGAAAKGAPVAFKTGREGFLLHMMPVAVNREAPHPNAARLFVDWLMSEPTQRELAKQGVGLSPLSTQKELERSGAWVLDIETISAADTKAFLKKLDAALKGS